MRARPHGANDVVPLRSRRFSAGESPLELRERRPAASTCTYPAVGLFAAVCLTFLATGLIGCNSMSGNFNNQVGMWNYQQGNYQAAREEFTRAAADDPHNASFTYNLACAIRRQGDLGRAEATYQQALRIDPSHQPSYHALAELMIAEGRRAEATELISTWAERNPRDSGAQVEMAWMQHENGDLKGAEQSLYLSLAARPNNPIATAQLGQLYQEMGQPDRAAVMYRRSLNGDWLQPQVRTRLASLQSSGGFEATPPTMFASNFGGPVVPTSPYPASSPVNAQLPRAQMAAVPIPANDDPAHLD
jgi:Tfp pilus assembly protein PilF